MSCRPDSRSVTSWIKPLSLPCPLELKGCRERWSKRWSAPFPVSQPAWEGFRSCWRKRTWLLRKIGPGSRTRSTKWSAIRKDFSEMSRRNLERAQEYRPQVLEKRRAEFYRFLRHRTGGVAGGAGAFSAGGGDRVNGSPGQQNLGKGRSGRRGRWPSLCAAASRCMWRCRERFGAATPAWQKTGATLHSVDCSLPTGTPGSLPGRIPRGS